MTLAATGNGYLIAHGRARQAQVLWRNHERRGVRGR